MDCSVATSGSGFAFALQASGWTVLLEQIAIDAANPALSLFEAKYARSGHALWRVRSHK